MESPQQQQVTDAPRKKRRTALKENPPKTAAATLMEYIVKENENKKLSTTTQHPVDAFLAGVTPTLKKLSPQQWHYTKGEIFATVQKYLRVGFFDDPST